MSVTIPSNMTSKRIIIAGISPNLSIEFVDKKENNKESPNVIPNTWTAHEYFHFCFLFSFNFFLVYNKY